MSCRIDNKQVSMYPVKFRQSFFILLLIAHSLWVVPNLTKVAIIVGSSIVPKILPNEVSDLSSLKDDFTNVKRCQDLPIFPVKVDLPTSCVFNQSIPIVCGGVPPRDDDYCYHLSDFNFSWVPMQNLPNLHELYGSGTECVNYGNKGNLWKANPQQLMSNKVYAC